MSTNALETAVPAPDAPPDRSLGRSFATLVGDVAGCRACDRMAYAHVLGASNGPLEARLLIVGEAPGRLGAARTGVPFQGDRSGERLDALLRAADLDRSEVFITNAVLCNPLTSEGDRARNRRPLAREVAACGAFLERTLGAVEAPVVAALGGAALAALARIEAHGVARVSEEAGRARPWAGRTLVPLVHPSPRTQGRRSWERQIEDWRRLGEIVRDGVHVDPAIERPHDPVT
jgi:uracil-DNA glycosylase family 4